MSDIKIFYRENARIKTSRNIDILKKVALQDLVWIDLLDADEEIETQLEDFLKIYIQEDEEIEEIEMSSRYMETEDSLVANSHFLLDNYETEPVSFILKNKILVSTRNTELKSFQETVRKMTANPRNYMTGYHVLVALLETRVELDADMIEDHTNEITKMSNAIQGTDENMLIAIKDLQEKTMLIRENIIDKQRVCTSMLKSDLFPDDLKPRLAIVVKDINSLIEHTKFSFDRLDYLQDTFLGLVNIEQNKIIKIFTVVSVIFLPPTLIASIYGMNFQFMPELNWRLGYPFALSLMLLSIVSILLYFKKKKWL
ncbi:MAG: magnesium/cobalt transporter CorA [Paludibacteraceae bacterium]|nr:magnesium/cobalt transporter CorA [Paludibacteraceae bacterium]